ncbi:MAG: hypothetical protein R3C70_07080 [Geminicoccaceae bacterium]
MSGLIGSVGGAFGIGGGTRNNFRIGYGADGVQEFKNTNPGSSSINTAKGIISTIQQRTGGADIPFFDIKAEGGKAKIRVGGKAFGDIDAALKSIGYAVGGLIGGPFDGTDSQLVRAMPGEFIVNSGATKQHMRLLESLNSNRGVPAQAGASARPAAALEQRPAPNINLHGDLIADDLSMRAFARKLARLIDEERRI